MRFSSNIEYSIECIPQLPFCYFHIVMYYVLYVVFWKTYIIRRPLAKGGARLEASLAGASDPSFFAWLNPAAGGTFSGLCFASLGHESCCCLRLSLAVFQGQTEG